MKKVNNISKEDLDEIVLTSKESFNKLENATVFVTGGSGFFGKWIISSIIHANLSLTTKIKVHTITRNLEKFKIECPDYFLDPNVSIIEGDLRSLENKELNCDYLIHTAANVLTGSLENREDYISSELSNTRSVLSFALKNRIKRIVYTSSGAVYGNRDNLQSNSEENLPTPTELSPYGESKIKSEELITKFCKENSIESNIGRCFAFLGGHLPLSGSFAAGNFINNILNGEDIVISGNGQPLRSFMYMTDLTSALLKLLASSGNGYIVNIGSEEEVSIEDLANEISIYSENSKVVLKNKELEKQFNKYIPSLRLADSIFKIKVKINFSEAIQRTLSFYMNDKIGIKESE